MIAILKDYPEMADKLIPSFHPGCRCLTPCEGYLEALQQKNARFCMSGIDTEKVIRTSEGEVEFDLIVCATGFDNSSIPPYKLVGLNGSSLEEKWKVDPAGFFAVQVDTMPTFYMFNGPNCSIAHESVLTQGSWTCDYILCWAKKIVTQDIK